MKTARFKAYSIEKHGVNNIEIGKLTLNIPFHINNLYSLFRIINF